MYNTLYFPVSFLYCFFFFFNDTATTEIYTLSLHDALPISIPRACGEVPAGKLPGWRPRIDRKSTRLNSSHITISYAVFCLKKKKKKHTREDTHRVLTLRSSSKNNNSYA